MENSDFQRERCLSMLFSAQNKVKNVILSFEKNIELNFEFQIKLYLSYFYRSKGIYYKNFLLMK